MDFVALGFENIAVPVGHLAQEMLRKNHICFVRALALSVHLHSLEPGYTVEPVGYFAESAAFVAYASLAAESVEDSC